jgi:hypothetical protein
LLHTWQTTPGGDWYTGGQGGWEFLGSGYQITQVTVGYNYDGRMEVFGIDGHGSLLHTWQTAPSGSWVDGGWEPLGSDWQIAKVAVYQNEDGRMEVLGLDISDTLLRTWQTAPSDGWSSDGWEQLGGTDSAEVFYTNIAVARDLEGRLELFGVNPDAVSNNRPDPYMYRHYQSAPNNGWIQDSRNFWDFG